MTCSCPKCSAGIRLDHVSLPEDGTSNTCPECKSRFWTNKESFALRAVRKTGTVYCATCGDGLGPLTVCKGCGALFPDYFVVQTSKPVKRQIKAAAGLFDFSLEFGKGSYGQSQSSTSKSSKGLLIGVALLALFAVLAAAIGTKYVSYKAERQYAANYVLALYGIKSGRDLSIEKCLKIIADGKAKRLAGQDFAPVTGTEEINQLNKVKAKVDLVMQKLAKPQKAFITSHEKLVKLNDAYAKLNGLALAPAASWSSFNDSLTTLDNDYKSAAQTLKSSLPAELQEELRTAMTKYKGLRDF